LQVEEKAGINERKFFVGKKFLPFGMFTIFILKSFNLKEFLNNLWKRNLPINGGGVAPMPLDINCCIIISSVFLSFTIPYAPWWTSPTKIEICPKFLILNLFNKFKRRSSSALWIIAGQWSLVSLIWMWIDDWCCTHNKQMFCS